MAAPGMYLISVSICLGILYLVYIAVFRFTTFFMMNRYYLLGSLLFSFVAPAVDLPLSDNAYQNFLSDHITTTFQSQEHEFAHREQVTSLSMKTIRYDLVLSMVYYLGAAVVLLRICYSLRHILKLKNRAERSCDANFRIFRTHLTHPFSFFNWIFIPKYDISPVILAHEKIHIRQFHAIDLIIAEIATVLLWFNPTVYLYKISMKAQHEYLADAYTIHNGVQVDRYLKVLLHQVQVESSIGAISHFYSKSIKNRIIMITKNKTSIGFSVVYLLVIPVCCLLLFAFSNKRTEMSFLNQDVVAINSALAIIVDPAHGGSDFGAQSVSGLAEKKLTLSIAKKVQRIGNEKGIKVILTRSDDESLSLEQRAAFSAEGSARVFISLHVNNDDGDASKAGIDCIISEKNAAFEQSKLFSNHLVKELEAIESIGVNGIMKSDFYILRSSQIPAVALELGYLSNERDYAFLRQEENQKALAEAIISAAIKHLK